MCFSVSLNAAFECIPIVNRELRESSRRIDGRSRNLISVSLTEEKDNQARYVMRNSKMTILKDVSNLVWEQSLQK
jgi:hypothetical protein